MHSSFGNGQLLTGANPEGTARGRGLGGERGWRPKGSRSEAPKAPSRDAEGIEKGGEWRGVFSLPTYRVAQKLGTIIYQILTDFQNYFTVRIRRKFVITLSLRSHRTSSVSLHYLVKCQVS